METVWDRSLLNRATVEPDGMHTEMCGVEGVRDGEVWLLVHFA